MLLVPSLLRGRLESSPVNGVRSFERDMGVIAKTNKAAAPGRWIMIPRSEVTRPIRRRSRVIRRRRLAFQRLLVTAAVTFLIGIVPGLRWMWFVHLAVDAVIGFYVLRLLRWKRDEEERARIVMPLPTDEPLTAEERAQSG